MTKKSEAQINFQALFPAQQKRGQVKRLSENRVSQNASKVSKGLTNFLSLSLYLINQLHHNNE